MKLLRLTTDDSNGIFNSFLHSELNISPMSKIALGALSAEIDLQELVIDASNSVVTFQTRTGTTHTIRLTHAIYNKANAATLLTDLQLKMNEALGIRNANNFITTPSEIGKQVRVSKTGGKVAIDLRQAKSAPYNNDLITNRPQATLDGVVKNAIDIAFNVNEPILFGGATTQNYGGGQNWVQSVPQTYRISQGCGVHRARLHTLVDRGFAGGAQGFAISLHTVNPTTYLSTRAIVGNTADGTGSDIRFGIKVDALTGTYDTIVDGVSTASGNTLTNAGGFGGNQGFFAAGSVRNDTVGLEVCNGNVHFILYRDNGLANPPTVLQLRAPVPYNNTDDLFCSYSLFGAGDTGGGAYGCALSTLRFTPDPYKKQSAQTEIDVSNFHDKETATVGTSSPPRQFTGQTNHDIQFTTDAVAQYLGFNSIRFPQQNFIATARLPMVAPNAYSAMVVNDTCLIELNNLQIESYDAFDEKRQRVNILAVIPVDDINSKIVYETNNLNFLDLNNKHPLKMTSFKARLLRTDYQSFDVKGITSMVLFITD